MSDPLAYHITWTTYGTWLHGDERGWVHKDLSGIQEPNKDTYQHARNAMQHDPVVLNSEQRDTVNDTILEVIEYRRWFVHALNTRTTHVHVVLTAALDPTVIMNQLKAWCSRRLNEKYGYRKKWWTQHGSTKWVNDEAYFEEVIDYVMNRQSHQPEA